MGNSPHDGHRLLGWVRKSQAMETSPGLPLWGPEGVLCPDHPSMLFSGSPRPQPLPQPLSLYLSTLAQSFRAPHGLKFTWVMRACLTPVMD